MKNKLAPELISAAMIGVGFGLIGNHVHEKWHRLGREAFLARESQYFEKLYAAQVSLLHEILIWTLAVLVAYAVFKGLAVLIAKVFE
jgi:hypothetical protein